MASVDEMHINSERFLQELRSWKFLAETCTDAFNKDPFLKELLSFKIDILQGYIDELRGWEKLENPIKCQYAIDQVKFFLGQVQVLIDRALDEHCKEAWLDHQRELKSVKYVPSLDEYIVTKGKKNLA